MGLAPPPRTAPQSCSGAGPPQQDFSRCDLGGGVGLHLRRTAGFATTRVDVLLRHPLERRRHTAVALLSRLLERGTRQLPDILSLNRYLDDLYGAGFSVSAGKLGAWQTLHMCLDVVEARLAPDGVDPLPAAFAFLGDILHRPALEAGAFPAASVAQEKAALAQAIAAHLCDRGALPLRRCTEEMCRGQACALSPQGEAGDLPQLDGGRLLELHRRGLRECPFDIYVSSAAPASQLVDLARTHLVGARSTGGAAARVEDEGRGPWALAAAPRSVVERCDVQQGRLALGYRTDVRLAQADYAALTLGNMLLGGDVHSRLYRAIREERGLAYHVGSYLEPLCGLLYVEAGIEPNSLPETRARIDEALADLGGRGPGEAELDRARQVAGARLAAVIDDREALMRFAYGRLVAGADPSRQRFRQCLDRVQSRDVARAISSLHLDTVYFMMPATGPEAG